MHPEPDDLTITATDGLLLAGKRWGSRPAPATVVYVHGLLADSNYWTPLACCLYERLGDGITQIAYDQRGHGNSGKPHRRLTTTMHRLAEDLDTVLTQASGSIVLVSHSAGSLLLHAWAERYPHRAAALSGVVMFNGAAEFPEFTRLPKAYRIWPQRLHGWRNGPLDCVSAAAAALLERRFRKANARRRSLEHPAAETRCDARVITDVLAAYSDAYLSKDTEIRMRSVPSFVLAGERDRVVPPAQAIRLAERVWADYELVPGVGHSLPHSNPERAAETILQALDVAYRADTDPAESAQETL